MVANDQTLEGCGPIALVHCYPAVSRFEKTFCCASAAMASQTNGPLSSGSKREVPPATLPNTPSSFPISEQELIRKAQHILEGLGGGVDDPSVLADNFRFEFPVIKLDKKVLAICRMNSFAVEEVLALTRVHSAFVLLYMSDAAYTFRIVSLQQHSSQLPFCVSS